jgi:uncharacterized protein (TIGR00251 family)
MKVTIKITPNAKKTEIVNCDDDVFKIRIAAKPVDGKANDELIRFLSKEWKIPQAQILIIQGRTSKNKVIEIPDGSLL